MINDLVETIKNFVFRPVYEEYPDRHTKMDRSLHGGLHVSIFFLSCLIQICSKHFPFHQYLAKIYTFTILIENSDL